ncbi:hypothetical protein WBG78_20360 [Chryseolinea sp. T2]|uniref:hypothetical protein n=1 Tax=Chryseolinea sp. T2 TaxID=3129255 RepID=UPI00307863FC
MRFLAILFMLSSQLLPGQELKRVVTTYPNKENVMEVYYVLKGDNAVKQGEYLSFYDHELTTDQLRKLKGMDLSKELLGFKEKGQYAMNKRTGKWITYDAPHKNKSFTAYNARAEEGRT